MKMIPFLFVLFLAGLQATEHSRQTYLDLIQKHPSLILDKGNAAKGEIEIITDPVKMAAIEQKANRDVGVVWQDKYWLWINDAVQFPSGFEGVYARIVWVKGLDGAPGVAVLPLLPDGRIVLNCNYRHATRSWELELPRGGISSGESIHDAAKREALEETGMVVDTLVLLGEMPPDSGLTSTIVPIFLAKVIAKQERAPEESEAIEEIIALSQTELEEAFRNGSYRCMIRGEEKTVAVRDPFLAFALLKLSKEPL